MSAMFTMNLLPTDAGARDNFRWCLDYPVLGQSFSSSASMRLPLRGWALAKSERSVSLLVRTGGVLRGFPFNTQRPDVIRAVLGVESSRHHQIVCGFDVEAIVDSDTYIGFDDGGGVFWICCFESV